MFVTILPYNDTYFLPGFESSWHLCNINRDDLMEDATYKKLVERNPIFATWGWICLGISIVGFWPSYIEPSLAGTFSSLSPSISWHVFFTTLWLVLMISQPTMILLSKMNLHRLFGLFSVFLALGVVYTGVIVQVEVMGSYAQHNDIRSAVALPFFRFIALSVYAIWVTAAITLVRIRPTWHKRLILFGTLALLQAPLDRMYGNVFGFQEISGPLGVFTHIALMVVFVIWDRLAYGRFHPASVWSAILITLIVFGISPFVESGWWQELAAQLAGIPEIRQN